MKRPQEPAPPGGFVPALPPTLSALPAAADEPIERHALVIAELNHRIRNILNLIRSLVAQSREGCGSIDQFATTIASRIDALARAHDQLTRNSTSPASLHELIRVESDAYAGSEVSRIVVDGPDPLIAPHAFTTLALVIHELLTNSCKYGALSNSAGSVAIEIARDPDDGLRIDWTESGGPPVATPSRRGFGSTIIERTIPHELAGSAGIEFAEAGVRARITIPARYVAAYGAPRLAASQIGDEADRTPQHIAHLQAGVALIVEDNAIIAMEAEDLLGSIGFTRCDVVGSVDAARRRIVEGGVSFAMLDVNLGDESAEAIAALLEETGIPFIFASGYDEQASRFPTVPVVTKPYSRRDLIAALALFAA